MDKTENDFWQAYLSTAKGEFSRYKSLADRAIDQLTYEELLQTTGAEDNSVAILVKHITGNIRRRFTNFLNEDGEKPWRQRDSEFEKPYTNKEEMLQAWESAWALLFKTLKDVEGEDWNRQVLIRNESHNLIRAFTRQLGHYASHVGQIVYIAKQIKGKDWQTLSIPRGQSEEHNQKFFPERQ